MRGGSPIPEPDWSVAERRCRESLMRGGVFRLVERFKLKMLQGLLTQIFIFISNKYKIEAAQNL